MESQEMLLWGLEINDSVTSQLIAQMVKVGLSVGSICFVCNLGYNYVKHGLSSMVSSDENKFPDIGELARTIVLMICIGIYPSIAQVIIGSLAVIDQTTRMTTQAQNDWSEYTNSFSELNEIKPLEKGLAEESSGGEYAEFAQMEQHNKETGNDSPTVSTSILGDILSSLNPMNLAASGLHAVAALLVQIIKLIIFGISTIVIKALIILGPLAFAFSILPVFEKQLSQWFGTLVTTGMVFTTMNVLDNIMYTTFKSIHEQKDHWEDAYLLGEVLALDICIIGLYCSSYWLTSKYVGRGDAGRVLSTITGLGTAAAGLALGGGGAAVGGAAANVSNAASAGGNVINQD